MARTPTTNCISKGLLGVTLLAALSTTQAGGPELLMRMNQAFAQASYDGIFTYYSGDEMTSLRVVHKVVDGVQQERLVHLNGAPREILRHGDEVLCIVMPGDDIAVLEQSIPAGPFARAFVREFDRLAGLYEVQTMGEGRVADRPAIRVAVNPLDEHRYGFRLWLDEETYLLLRSEMVDQAGNRLEVFQFSKIVFGDDVKAEALEADEPQGSMISHLTLRSADDKPEVATEDAHRWHAGWIPDGFRMAAVDVRQKRTNQAMNSLIYSDGIATFSIFLEPMPTRGAASMMSQSGATVVITRGIGLPGTADHTEQASGFAAQRHYYLATLVGEIPPETAKRIIESVSTR